MIRKKKEEEKTSMPRQPIEPQRQQLQCKRRYERRSKNSDNGDSGEEEKVEEEKNEGGQQTKCLRKKNRFVSDLCPFGTEHKLYCRCENTHKRRKTKIKNRLFSIMLPS